MLHQNFGNEEHTTRSYVTPHMAIQPFTCCILQRSLGLRVLFVIKEFFPSPWVKPRPALCIYLTCARYLAVLYNCLYESGNQDQEGIWDISGASATDTAILTFLIHLLSISHALFPISLPPHFPPTPWNDLPTPVGIHQLQVHGPGCLLFVVAARLL